MVSYFAFSGLVALVYMGGMGFCLSGSFQAKGRGVFCAQEGRGSTYSSAIQYLSSFRDTTKGFQRKNHIMDCSLRPSQNFSTARFPPSPPDILTETNQNLLTTFLLKLCLPLLWYIVVRPAERFGDNILSLA